MRRKYGRFTGFQFDIYRMMCDKEDFICRFELWDIDLVHKYISERFESVKRFDLHKYNESLNKVEFHNFYPGIILDSGLNPWAILGIFV